LDGDGRPEIVVYTNLGAVEAWRYDPAAGWSRFWAGHDAAGTPVTFSEGATGWGGPSIADLDDDGLPEILSGGLVYDSTGLLVDSSLGLGVLHRVSGFPAAADLDADGLVELAGGAGLWEFDPAAKRWVPEWTGRPNGFTAVADFGTYPADMGAWDRGTLDGLAEIAVVANGQARIDNLAGQAVFGPVSLPSSDGGGPPTIGDFDGDGRAELAAAGSDSYTVFDPDCTGTPDASYCPTMRTDGILWTMPSQDHSSNITGSSLFDFEGDGSVEAVYADECFVRVYEGSTGRVLYSQWRSSCTWNENPVVADTDGDFAAELVVPSNESCGTAPDLVNGMGGLPYDTSPSGNPMDPLFAGLPCKQPQDCLSGVCDAGLCRCSSDAECGSSSDGFVCAPPPAGTPGNGNTCRAEWRGSMHGVRVYRDALDRWVGSRTIWNQHAYYVTNVNEDGTVPRTSSALLNWRVQGLNNFRQNVQGDLHPEYSPDATAGRGRFSADCPGGVLTLSIRVCNRGTAPVAAGIPVGFFDGDPDAGGQLVCLSSTSGDLQPGQCETVTCDWQNAPTDAAHDVVVVVDPDGERTECIEGNNRGFIEGARCRLE
ncbi:MAG: VCBS repeat-containing protein, partial [Deltaproteobacteria bacterium]